MKRLLHAFFTCLVLLSGASTFAVEPLTTKELASHCSMFGQDEGSEDEIFCIRYIQGFIDGAVATDERVTVNVAKDAGPEETFSDRAIRTRIGARLERYGPSVYAEFCLGKPVPLIEVVAHVVTELRNEERVKKSPLARDLVYGMLRRDYPCTE